MTAVGRADARNVVVAAVRVARLTIVVILRNHVVVLLTAGQMEFSLSVGYPDTEFRTTETAEHDALDLRNL